MSARLRYTALIWDADGTLFDTYPGFAEGYRRALDALGCSEPPASIMALARVSLGHATRTLAERHALEEEALASAFQQHYGAISPERQPPFPDVVALCQQMVEVGGRNFIYTHRGRASLAALLDAYGMTGLFVDWVTADDDLPRKPDPAGFTALIERYGLPRERTLGIGDRALDVRGAQAAGIDACYFGAAPPEDARPEYTVARYEDLARILFTHGEG